MQIVHLLKFVDKKSMGITIEKIETVTIYHQLEKKTFAIQIKPSTIKMIVVREMIFVKILDYIT